MSVKTVLIDRESRAFTKTVEETDGTQASERQATEGERLFGEGPRRENRGKHKPCKKKKAVLEEQRRDTVFAKPVKPSLYVLVLAPAGREGSEKRKEGQREHTFCKDVLPVRPHSRQRRRRRHTSQQLACGTQRRGIPIM